MNTLTPLSIRSSLLLISITGLTGSVFCADASTPTKAQQAARTLQENFQKVCRPHKLALQQRAEHIQTMKRSATWSMVSLALCALGTISKQQTIFPQKRSGNLLHPLPWYLSPAFWSYTRYGVIFATGLCAGYYITRYIISSCHPLVQNQGLNEKASLQLLVQEIVERAEERFADRIQILELDLTGAIRKSTNNIIFNTRAQVQQLSTPTLISALETRINSLASSAAKLSDEQDETTESGGIDAEGHKAMLSAINASLQDLKKFYGIAPKPPEENKDKSTDSQDDET